MADETTVRIQTKNWGDMVQKSWGEEYRKPEPAYEFSNGKKFDTPSDGGGIYRPEAS